nr:hypothetical protein GCM10020092_043000 [Actinoplanes digitatis]
MSDLWRTIVGVTTTIHQRIAQELGVREGQVTAAVDLLDGGATVPFIARYRKEVTGTLDDQQLRTLEERLGYLRELEDRRAAVLESIRSQGKLDDALEAQILGAESKARLEDIYLPFKPKRRTRAQIAREAGLEPLADLLVADATRDPKAEAAAYVDADKGVADVAAALDGARAILVERFAEDPDLIGELRERMWTKGRLIAKVRDGKQTDGAKFADYFDFAEPFTKLPSHRILAMFRGEKEDVLDLTMEPEEGAEDGAPSSFEASVAQPVRHLRPRPRRRPVAARHGPLGVAHPDPDPPRRRPAGPALAGGRGGGRAGLRRQPARPAARRAELAPGRPWGSTPVSAPASRSRSSTGPASASRPRRSTRTCRRTSGTSRCTPWPPSPGSTTSTWSRSATAPLRGRPTGWRPT